MTFFGVASLTVNCVNWLLCLLPHSRTLEKAARYELHYLMRFWMRSLRAMGIVLVDWPEIGKLRGMRGTVVAANHPSLLDICWILAASPNVTCVVKSSIRSNRFFSASARLAGYISNDCGMDGLHKAVDRLKEGDLLVVFPEGTRTRTPPMNPFKPGFALMAQQANAPIQTLYLRTSSKSFRKGVFFSCGKLPIRYNLRLGPRFEPTSGEPSKHLAHSVENAMRSDLESAKLWN
jgi:1-acyl-sn-glycerol-3-phosphate acyltransferase